MEMEKVSNSSVPPRAFSATDIMRAYSVARWAGHGWAYADPEAILKAARLIEKAGYGPAEAEAAIRAAYRATSEPGPVGWGIESPDFHPDGEVRVVIGTSGQLMFRAGPEDDIAEYTGPNGEQRLAVDTNLRVRVQKNPRPRDWVRVGAVIAAAWVVVPTFIRSVDDIPFGEPKDLEWTLRQFTPMEVMKTDEFRNYLELARNAGHVLAGPVKEAQR